jgi:hypothetical protein
MALLTIFQLYRGGQFYWWRKPQYPEKTTDLLQDSCKSNYHKIMAMTPPHLILNNKFNKCKQKLTPGIPNQRDVDTSFFYPQIQFHVAPINKDGH